MSTDAYGPADRPAEATASKSAGFRPTARPLAEGRAGRSRDFRCTCPNCGAELWDKECKSRCPRCHFFTDCSDPW